MTAINMTAINKIYRGTTTTDETTTVGDYNDPDNWEPYSLVNSTYRWLAAGSDTGAYYLDLSGGGDPGLSSPGNVQENGANMTAGTLGALASGEWAYGDDDTLGYSTIYVQLADDADPDSKATNYVTMTQVPVATDNVLIPAGAQQISSGLEQSGVAIADFTVDEGYDGLIGTAAGYLKIDPNSFSFAGSGLAYINIGSANIDVTVTRSASGGGTRPAGFFLLGSNIANLITTSGASVSVAGLPNETATVATWRNLGAAIHSGTGLSLTTLVMESGSGVLRWTSAITTATLRGGSLTTKGSGTTTTFNLDGGTFVYGSGNITTLNQDGGTLDTSKLTTARTIATLNVAPAELCTQRVGALLTITTDNTPSDPYTRTYDRN